MGMTALRAGRGSARARPRSETGASAVEFALVAPILFLVLFAILDYGIWFNNSLSLRQGIREAARQAVVTCADPVGSCKKDMDDWAATTRDEVGAITGALAVRIRYPSGWTQGAPLVVCGVLDTKGLTGLTPMPNSGVATSVTRMSIESTQTGMADQSPVPSDPTGKSWTWCR
jgi:hypothetical protein